VPLTRQAANRLEEGRLVYLDKNAQEGGGGARKEKLCRLSTLQSGDRLEEIRIREDSSRYLPSVPFFFAWRIQLRQNENQKKVHCGGYGEQKILEKVSFKSEKMCSLSHES